MRQTGTSTKSSDLIPKSVDRALDKAVPSGKTVEPGISLHNGPADDMDLGGSSHRPGVSNGVSSSKRKSRTSLPKSYKDESSDEDEPIVSLTCAPLIYHRQLISPS